MMMIPEQMEMMSHNLTSTPDPPTPPPDPHPPTPPIPRHDATGPLLAIMGTNNNNQGQDVAFVNLHIDDDSSDEGDPLPPQNPGQIEDDLKKELIFSPYYHVLRYTRPLRRAEVLGFVFTFLTIVCIAVQAQTGLEAVGFFVPTVKVFEDVPPSSSHHSHTFSWRILSDFFLSDSVSNEEKECLYLSKNRVIFRRRNSERREDWMHGGSDIDSEEVYAQLLLEAQMAKMLNARSFDEEKISNVDVAKIGENENATQQQIPHRLVCGKSRITEGWTWLCKYLINSFLSILNLICSTLLFSCVRCRRRKGFQFTLMLPAFLAVFLGIFQQVPTIFTYSYAGISLTDEMNEASIRGVPPMYMSPIWDETQYHGKCCGVNGPETWTVRRRGFDQDMYPPSCCNTDVYECNDKYAKLHEVWENGCYKQEYDRVKFYEFFSMIILMVKLFAEMGILWCLSDLTRYDYPRPEHQLNAACDVRDFEVQTRGCASILGVTERQKLVIKLNKFVARKYMFRTQNSGICKTINVRSVDGHQGCIEIRRPRRNRNTENAIVDLDRGRNQGYIFISC